MSTRSAERALSPLISAMLMLAVTIVLATLALLLALQLPNLCYDPTAPDIFQITCVTYSLSADGIHYIGVVTITNTDSKDYRNRYIRANTYVNDKPADCNIPTLNNNLFISQAVHTGVAKLRGVGTWGEISSPLAVWPANSPISIVYEKGTMWPGDRITLEFFDTRTNQLLSRDSWPDGGNNKEKWMRLYFNHRGA